MAPAGPGTQMVRCLVDQCAVEIQASDSVCGVKASANLYSLIENRQGCGLEPYA